LYKFLFLSHINQESFRVISECTLVLILLLKVCLIYPYTVVGLFPVFVFASPASFISSQVNWQVKVFGQCLDVLYQNLFFGTITLSL